MQKFGVIGYPLTHSLSPQIHNFAFRKLNIEAEYEKIEIEPDNFAESINHLRDRAYSGLNITIPYKLKIMSFLDEIDSDAKAVGAVNTIVKKGNKWIGYNTDVDGFRSPILDLKDRITDCLILGAGGAARAITVELANKKIDVQVRIESPKEGYVYLRNHPLLKLPGFNLCETRIRGLTYFIGKPTIKINITTDEEIAMVIYNIDGDTDYNLLFTEESYDWELQKHGKKIFRMRGRHKVGVHVHTVTGKTAYDEMDFYSFTAF